MRTAPVFLALVVAGAGLFPGPAPAQTQAAPAPQSEHRRADAVLQQAARFEHQVTGVTVSERAASSSIFRAGRKTRPSRLPKS